MFTSLPKDQFDKLQLPKLVFFMQPKLVDLTAEVAAAAQQGLRLAHEEAAHRSRNNAAPPAQASSSHRSQQSQQQQSGGGQSAASGGAAASNTRYVSLTLPAGERQKLADAFQRAQVRSTLQTQQLCLHCQSSLRSCLLCLEHAYNCGNGLQC